MRIAAATVISCFVIGVWLATFASAGTNNDIYKMQYPDYSYGIADQFYRFIGATNTNKTEIGRYLLYPTNMAIYFAVAGFVGAVLLILVIIIAYLLIFNNGAWASFITTLLPGNRASDRYGMYPDNNDAFLGDYIGAAKKTNYYPNVDDRSKYPDFMREDASTSPYNDFDDDEYE